ncbi:hypothetical protein [Dactylosporangium sp. CA-139066]|uniref:hypothetical protein n=1 Tax=Dactylosporangium sp. CA-139066 TaxID=3239930 RepID=UPI003D8AAC71
MSSDVRHHRPFSPNRRPLLISALLVLLTSVPTMIVVAAGSATLETAPPARSPVVADPQAGPVVVGSGSAPGRHSSGPGAGQSAGAVPTAPRPPLRPPATATERGGGHGAGGGNVLPPPKRPPGTSLPSEAGTPPIQDRAWPGWDDRLQRRKESSRNPSGSVDRSNPVGRFGFSGLPSGPRVGVSSDDRPCRRERLAGPLGASGRAALSGPARRGLVSFDAPARVRHGVVVDHRH